MALIQEQKEAYLKNPGKCPFCQSRDIDGGFVEIDGKSAWQKVSCNNCEKEWNDIYTLSDVEEY